jgi:hypothetical protein
MSFDRVISVCVVSRACGTFRENRQNRVCVCADSLERENEQNAGLSPSPRSGEAGQGSVDCGAAHQGWETGAPAINM